MPAVGILRSPPGVGGGHGSIVGMRGGPGGAAGIPGQFGLLRDRRTSEVWRTWFISVWYAERSSFSRSIKVVPSRKSVNSRRSEAKEPSLSRSSDDALHTVTWMLSCAPRTSFRQAEGLPL